MRKKVISAEGETYMVRYYLIGDGSGAGWELYLHKILRKDWARDPHDHPWKWFLSIVLWGGYEQELTDAVPYHRLRHNGTVVDERFRLYSESKKIRFFNLFRNNPYRSESHVRRFHVITKLHRKPTWTLVLVPPKYKEWGFMHQHLKRFIPVSEYERIYRHQNPKDEVFE